MSLKDPESLKEYRKKYREINSQKLKEYEKMRY